MGLYRGLGDGKVKGDLLVQFAFANQLQNTGLLIGERRETQVRFVCLLVFAVNNKPPLA